MRNFNPVIILTLGLLACGRKEIKPVDLYPEDICSYCKMAISEKMFAGEIVRDDGEVWKFDDLGCLRAHMKSERGQERLHLFFRVMEKQDWVKGEDATLVKSDMIKTPMGSGMIAFAEKKHAEDFVRQHGGKIIALEEFLKGQGFHER